MQRLVLVAVLLAACHHRGPVAPTRGGIGGLVLDRFTGDVVAGTVTAHDEDSFAVSTVAVADDGSYLIEGLRPGSYSMVVEIKGGPLHFEGIPVTAGYVTAFDIPIDRGNIGSDPVRFAELAGSNLIDYQPSDLAIEQGRLEGTITDLVTLERVGGAVVTTTDPVSGDTLTAVSDDRGWFRFGEVPPGTYTLSAFYQVPRRGQIEVRRADVPVAAGHAVVVPMSIEVTGPK